MVLRKRARASIVAGMVALAFATAMMKFDNDFLTGVGFGLGLPLLAAGVCAIARSR